MVRSRPSANGRGSGARRTGVPTDGARPIATAPRIGVGSAARVVSGGAVERVKAVASARSHAVVAAAEIARVAEGAGDRIVLRRAGGTLHLPVNRELWSI